MSDKIISVNEFKNWLSGVLDFQPENWVPDLIQWNKILEKIGQLSDNAVPFSASKLPSKLPSKSVQTEDINPETPNNQSESQVAGGILDGPKVQLPELEPRLAPRQVTVKQTSPPSIIDNKGDGRVIDTGKVYKTGNIDTSINDYKSTFI